MDQKIIPFSAIEKPKPVLKEQEASALRVNGEIVKAKNKVFQWSWLKKPKDKYQRKIFCVLLSKVKTTDTDFKIYAIPTSEIIPKQAVKILHNKHYQEIKKAVKNLSANGLIYEDDEREEFDILPFLQRASYKKGLLYLQLNDRLKDYLLFLKTSFTQFSLSEFLSLPTDYSMDLFGLLNSFKNLGSNTFEVDELRKRLCVKKRAMNDYAEFRIKVLEPSIKAINKFTSLKISYREFSSGVEGRSRGRAGVTHLLFEIKEQLKLPGIIED